jgi:hypothetical protein
MITSGGNRNPAKLDLDADTPRGRRCINQACLILLSTDATVPLEVGTRWKANAEGELVLQYSIVKPSGRHGRIDIYVRAYSDDNLVAIVEIKAPTGTQ